jgi:hypothetical protein
MALRGQVRMESAGGSSIQCGSVLSTEYTTAMPRGLGDRVLGQLALLPIVAAAVPEHRR